MRQSKTEEAASVREIGNKLFRDGRYELAINRYSEAITLDPSVATFFLNRCLCFGKLEKWSDSERDAREALNIDDESVKGHYYLANALVHLGDLDEAFIKITKSMTLAEKERNEATRTLQCQIREKRFEILGKIGSRDRDAEIYCLKEIREAAGDRCVDFLVLDNIIEDLQNRTVPEYLTCPLTLLLMNDPVLTIPAGITYERSALVDALAVHGDIDPVTRQPLQGLKFVQNLKMQEVTNYYLSNNKWANAELHPY